MLIVCLYQRSAECVRLIDMRTSIKRCCKTIEAVWFCFFSFWLQQLCTWAKFVDSIAKGEETEMEGGGNGEFGEDRNHDWIWDMHAQGCNYEWLWKLKSNDFIYISLTPQFINLAVIHNWESGSCISLSCKYVPLLRSQSSVTQWSSYWWLPQNQFDWLRWDLRSNSPFGLGTLPQFTMCRLKNQNLSYLQGFPHFFIPFFFVFSFWGI